METLLQLKKTTETFQILGTCDFLFKIYTTRPTFTFEILNQCRRFTCLHANYELIIVFRINKLIKKEFNIGSIFHQMRVLYHVYWSVFLLFYNLINSSFIINYFSNVLSNFILLRHFYFYIKSNALLSLTLSLRERGKVEKYIIEKKKVWSDFLLKTYSVTQGRGWTEVSRENQTNIRNRLSK